jgi:hypothetical protein
MICAPLLQSFPSRIQERNSSRWIKRIEDEDPQPADLICGIRLKTQADRRSLSTPDGTGSIFDKVKPRAFSAAATVDATVSSFSAKPSIESSPRNAPRGSMVRGLKSRRNCSATL